ncbi:MAG: hypothetical protein U1E05_21405, partial [Patescibacteria group bacterium]|nr:hypothetical protein [Patescibacteria group bacterium]
MQLLTVRLLTVQLRCCLLASVVLVSHLVHAAPEIAFISEPACNGEIVIITGEGLGTDQTAVKATCLGAYDAQTPFDPLSLPDAFGRVPQLPDAPTEDALDCKIVGRGPGFLQIEFRNLRQPWLRAPFVSAVWVGDGTSWSKPYLVNRPQAQWLYPRAQSPGEVVRVFGRTFAWGHQLPSALAVVRLVGSTD